MNRNSLSAAGGPSLFWRILATAVGITSLGVATFQARVWNFISVTVRVDYAITEWSEQTRIRVAAEARSLVKNGFSEKQDFLEGVFYKRALSMDQQVLLLRSLVQQYLFELRDRKPTLNRGGLGGIGQATRGNPDIILTADSKVLEITAEDVRGFPPSEFFRGISPVLIGNTGRLEVLSDPDGSAITIDGEKKQCTNKTFVVSAGDHKVTVASGKDDVTCKGKGRLSCSGTVNVPANETRQFRCPLP